MQKDIETQLDTLEKDGFMLVEGALTPAEVEHTRQRINHARQMGWEEGLNAVGNMWFDSLLDREPENFAPLVSHANVRPYLEGMLGKQCQLRSFRAHINPGPYLQEWHLDFYGYWQEQRAAKKHRLAVPPVGLNTTYYFQDNGPGEGHLKFIKKGHLLEPPHLQPMDRPRFEAWCEAQEHVVIYPKAGDCVVFLSHIPHQGAKERDDMERSNVVCHYQAGAHVRRHLARVASPGLRGHFPLRRMTAPEKGVPGRLAVKLKPAAERMVKKRHPWIFEQGIVKQNAVGKAGDLATIFDQKKDKFLACGLYDPHSPIRIKLLQFHQYAAIDAAWFAEKILQAFSLRLPLLATDTNSYRLISGENDGLPGLIADVYDTVLVLKLYSAIWLPYLAQILPLLQKQSGCDTIVLRLSRALSQCKEKGTLADGQVILGELDQEEVLFSEHGVRFCANVVHGHKTGYFLDQRHNRKKIGACAKGKKVLDVFAYTGGFSVHALAGGAHEVTSVDISAHALKAARKNAALNPHRGIHHTKVVDAFEHLSTLAQRQETFDIVVIDPPSFAKRANEAAKAHRRYLELAKLGGQLVRPKGLLLLASCSSRVGADDFFALCQEGIRAAKHHFTLKEKTYHDVDHPIGFPEGAYLKAGYWWRER